MPAMLFRQCATASTVEGIIAASACFSAVDTAANGATKVAGAAIMAGGIMTKAVHTAATAKATASAAATVAATKG